MLCSDVNATAALSIRYLRMTSGGNDLGGSKLGGLKINK